MKILKKIALTLLVLAIVYGIGRFIDVMYGSYSFVTRQPYTQMNTPHSVIVRYNSPEEEIGCVAYDGKKVCEKEATKEHKIFVNNLQKNHTYNYKVLSKSLKIDNTNRTFSTLSDDINSTQRMIVFGDSGKVTPKQLDVYHSAIKVANQEANKTRAIDSWLLLGDNAYKSGTQKQYNTSFFNRYKDFFKYITPWILNGNHDARRYAFYNIFDFPTHGEMGGVPSHNEYFYAIDNKNLHLVMIDSQLASLKKDSDLAKWLEKDLAATKKQWIVVGFHHPPYTKGSHDSDSMLDSGDRMIQMRENIVPIFEKYGVDLVLSGHSHVYERSKLMHKHYGYSQSFDPSKNIVENSAHIYHKSITKKPYDGTIYNVVGCSGKADHGPLNHPAMPVAYSIMGSLLLTIDAHKLHAEFITLEGNVKDYYEIIKE